MSEYPGKRFKGSAFNRSRNTYTTTSVGATSMDGRSCGRAALRAPGRIRQLDRARLAQGARSRSTGASAHVPRCRWKRGDPMALRLAPESLVRATLPLDSDSAPSSGMITLVGLWNRTRKRSSFTRVSCGGLRCSNRAQVHARARCGIAARPAMGGAQKSMSYKGHAVNTR